MFVNVQNVGPIYLRVCKLQPAGVYYLENYTPSKNVYTSIL